MVRLSHMNRGGWTYSLDLYGAVGNPPPPASRAPYCMRRVPYWLCPHMWWIVPTSSPPHTDTVVVVPGPPCHC